MALHSGPAAHEPRRVQTVGRQLRDARKLVAHGPHKVCGIFVNVNPHIVACLAVGLKALRG
ncbi:MAG: hypothetical protein ACK56I_03575, partial [bacterium]